MKLKTLKKGMKTSLAKKGIKAKNATVSILLIRENSEDTFSIAGKLRAVYTDDTREMKLVATVDSIIPPPGEEAPDSPPNILVVTDDEIEAVREAVRRAYGQEADLDSVLISLLEKFPDPEPAKEAVTV